MSHARQEFKAPLRNLEEEEEDEGHAAEQSAGWLLGGPGLGFYGSNTEEEEEKGNNKHEDRLFGLEDEKRFQSGTTPSDLQHECVVIPEDDGLAAVWVDRRAATQSTMAALDANAAVAASELQQMTIYKKNEGMASEHDPHPVESRSSELSLMQQRRTGKMRRRGWQVGGRVGRGEKKRVRHRTWELEHGRVADPPQASSGYLQIGGVRVYTQDTEENDEVDDDFLDDGGEWVTVSDEDVFTAEYDGMRGNGHKFGRGKNDAGDWDEDEDVEGDKCSSIDSDMAEDFLENMDANDVNAAWLARCKIAENQIGSRTESSDAEAESVEDADDEDKGEMDSGQCLAAAKMEVAGKGTGNLLVEMKGISEKEWWEKLVQLNQTSKFSASPTAAAAAAAENPINSPYPHIGHLSASARARYLAKGKGNFYEKSTMERKDTGRMGCRGQAEEEEVGEEAPLEPGKGSKRDSDVVAEEDGGRNEAAAGSRKPGDGRKGVRKSDRGRERERGEGRGSARVREGMYLGGLPSDEALLAMANFTVKQEKALKKKQVKLENRETGEGYAFPWGKGERDGRGKRQKKKENGTPVEKEQVRRELIHVKRMERDKLDLFAINISLLSVVNGSFDTHAFNPMVDGNRKKVAAMAALYHLKCSTLNTSGKKKSLLVVRTEQTSQPVGERAKKLKEMLQSMDDNSQRDRQKQQGGNDQRVGKGEASALRLNGEQLRMEKKKTKAVVMAAKYRTVFGGDGNSVEWLGNLDGPWIPRGPDSRGRKREGRSGREGTQRRREDTGSRQGEQLVIRKGMGYANAPVGFVSSGTIVGDSILPTPSTASSIAAVAAAAGAEVPTPAAAQPSAAAPLKPSAKLCSGSRGSKNTRAAVVAGAEGKHQQQSRREGRETSGQRLSPTMDMAAFEAHTTGFGSRMMLKMGYQFGQGLGKDKHGIATPLAAVVRPKSLGLGANA